MNKKPLPEDIIKKIEQEAADHVNNKYHLSDEQTSPTLFETATQDYIAGRTASVQPLIECFDLIKAYCENDGYNTAWILLKINEALSSFPSSPKPIEGGLRWVNGQEQEVPLRKRVPAKIWQEEENEWYYFTALRIFENIYQRIYPAERLTILPKEIFWLSESPSNTGEDASEPDPDFTLWVVVNRWEYNEQYHKWFNGHITEFKYKHVTHSQLYQLFLEHKNKQQP